MKAGGNVNNVGPKVPKDFRVGFKTICRIDRYVTYDPYSPGASAAANETLRAKAGRLKDVLIGFSTVYAVMFL